MSSYRIVRGCRVPKFLYGTAWKEERTHELTALALASGFVGIDTANQRKHYFEAAVGKAVVAALEGGKLTREALFLQTKFTYARGQDHRLPYDREASYAEQVAQSFASSLEHLQVDSIDSYVLHGPSARFELTDADWQVWTAMEALQRSGGVRLIGVSNVSGSQLLALLENAQVAPAFVQNRCFARTGWDRRVRAICDANDIVYQGFSLLTANLRELSRRKVKKIALRTGRTIPQLIFRFALQVGMLPLTGTSSAEHMREDLACLEDDFELDAADVKTLESLG